MADEKRIERANDYYFSTRHSFDLTDYKKVHPDERTVTELMASFASIEAAAERTRIGDESSQYLATISDDNPIGDGSMLIGMTPNDAYQLGWSACYMRLKTYIEQLRGADNGGTK